jgi:pimeloyl-ACP methyl ester carboxylesterase
MRKLFLPGFGASAGFYRRGLVADWRALEPPSFRATNGVLAPLRGWLLAELHRSDEPVWLAGHSMGGALAVLAASSEPGRVSRLTLVSPAGLPLAKPIAASLARFAMQVAQGRYELLEVRRGLGQTFRAPRAALRLARTLRTLDLTREMERVRESGIRAEVVACASDTLVTPAHCRAAARLLGAEYRELELGGGHMWMLDSWPQFARLLAAAP